MRKSDDPPSHININFNIPKYNLHQLTRILPVLYKTGIREIILGDVHIDIQPIIDNRHSHYQHQSYVNNLRPQFRPRTSSNQNPRMRPPHVQQNYIIPRPNYMRQYMPPFAERQPTPYQKLVHPRQMAPSCYYVTSHYNPNFRTPGNSNPGPVNWNDHNLRIPTIPRLLNAPSPLHHDYNLRSHYPIVPSANRPSFEHPPRGYINQNDSSTFERSLQSKMSDPTHVVLSALCSNQKIVNASSSENPAFYGGSINTNHFPVQNQVEPRLKNSGFRFQSNGIPHCPTVPNFYQFMPQMRQSRPMGTLESAEPTKDESEI